MTIVGGKFLSFDDPITLDGRVEYTDQHGISVGLDMRKYVALGKKSKQEYFKNGHLEWIEKGELTIGGFIANGMDKLAREFPKEVQEIIIEDET